jgi:hypothetical protein
VGRVAIGNEGNETMTARRVRGRASADHRGGTAGAGGEPIMRGWLRIGVVLSVLWIVGYPTYFFIDSNIRAWDRRQTCLNLQTTVFSELSSDQILHKCNQLADFMSLSYFVSGTDVRFFWAFILISLALFWILGGVIFWTVRWIRRGFTNAK